MSVELLNIDCMEYMQSLPDKAFDLAIVDPPYGIGANKMQLGNGKTKIYRGEEDWDAEPPKSEYFQELFRVSKEQIVWGGNYFIDLWQTPCKGFIIWDKGTGDNSFADGELAWTSFDNVAKIKKISWVGSNAKDRDGRFHPTQKPIELYAWILKNYAKTGWKILDTHLGSGSSAIAAEKLGFDFVGCEVDKKYYENAVARWKKECDLGLFQMAAIADKGSVGEKTNTLF